jgi:hypothetical protein
LNGFKNRHADKATRYGPRSKPKRCSETREEAQTS